MMKASLCIKSNGTPVDMSKVHEAAISKGIQVSKTVRKDNGDVYVDLPSNENMEKLVPLLEELPNNNEHEVVKIKSKLPAISILSVTEFPSKDELIEKIKKQNPLIKEKMDNGSEFSIVFYKNPKTENVNNDRNYYQVVARVSEDIRHTIKKSNNKIYMDLVAHRVVDRFYIKRCTYQLSVFK